MSLHNSKHFEMSEWIFNCHRCFLSKFKPKWTDPGCLWLFLSQWYHNMITISEQNDDSNFYIYMIYPYKKHSPELITSNLFFLFALVRGVRPSACCKYWTFSLELRQILCKILQINTKQLQGLSSGNTRS